MKDEPPAPRLACVDGLPRTLDARVAVGTLRGVLRAWSLDDGRQLWCEARPCVDFDHVDGALHVLRWTDAGPEVRVLDAATGEVRGVARLEGLDGADALQGLRFVGGAYVTSIGALVLFRAQGGEPVAWSVGGSVASWACTATTVCATTRDGSVNGFALGTLTRRWSREEFFATGVTSAGDTALVSTAAGDQDDASLVAIDAVTGDVRWNNTAFGAVLCADEEVTLVRRRRGWLAALDLRTGVARWQLRLPGEVLAGTQIAAGYAVLTGHALVLLDRDGGDRGGWNLSAATSLVASATTLVCGTARVLGRREAVGTVRRGGAAVAVTPEVVGIEPSPGRAPLAPAYTRLDEVRALLRAIDHLDEAWEVLATRGIIPSQWVGDPRRSFVDAERACSRPWSRGAMLAFACDVDGVTRAESLWREAQRRLGAAGDDVCRWCSARPLGILFGEQLLPSWTREARERAADALAPEVFARIDAAVADVLVVGPGYDITRAVLSAETEWRAAARVAPTVDEGANPFTPLRALLAEGYAFDAGDTLRARVFTDALDEVEALEEIPF